MHRELSKGIAWQRGSPGLEEPEPWARWRPPERTPGRHPSRVPAVSAPALAPHSACGGTLATYHFAHPAPP